MVLPSSTVNGTELSAQEFRDSILLRYARTPADLPTHCDRSDQKFTVCHALECKKGGLVISRHNDIQDELIDLASKALTPSAVRNEPRIHTSCHAEKLRTMDQHPVICNICKCQGEERGDVLIQGLWQQEGTNAIINVRITDLDAKSNISRVPMKVLATHEHGEKCNYLEPCLEQRCHFSPFVVSTDCLIGGKEAQTTMKKLSARLAKKTGKPYSVV